MIGDSNSVIQYRRDAAVEQWEFAAGRKDETGPLQSPAACSGGKERLSTGLHTARIAATVIVVISCAIISGEAIGADVAQKEINRTSVLEAKVFRLTNDERKRNGLPPLSFSEALSSVARQHSRNMCVAKTFQHESSAFPSGWRTLQARLGKAGVLSGGENIGYRTVSNDLEEWAGKMVEGWMKSPSHRNNLLHGRFLYMGVGIRECPNRIGYATELFSPDSGRIGSRVREFSRSLPPKERERN